MDKVLIIEDNDDSYLLIFLALKSIGLSDGNVIRCTHLQAVRQHRDEVFDIIITDLGLPDSEGLATFSYVHSIFPETPIVVLTGTSERIKAVEAIKLGAQDYLIKGYFDRNTLEKSIQYAIERKRIASDYKRLFTDSPVPMYIYEKGTFKFLTVNNAAIGQYGYSREEFLLMTALEIRPEDEQVAFVRSNSAVSNQYGDYGTWRHIRKNGEMFYVHIYAHATRFEGKEAIIVLALDIDKKLKAEKEVQEKNQEIENILESITDGFYTLNTRWEITYFNKEAERALGVTRDEVLGKNIWDFFPQSKEGEFFNKYSQALHEKVSVHFEEYYEPKDVWGAMSVYPTNHGIAVYFVDITEQKRIQDKIYIDQENLRAIINNTQDIIWSVDKNLNVISANQAFWDRLKEITGREKDEIKEEHFDAMRYTAWRQYFNRAFAGEPFKIVWTDNRNGKEVHEEVSFNPILDKNNEVIGVSCFSRDITQQKNYIDIIEKKNEQLEKIAWIQSHEVRSPVASILGLIQLFNTDNSSDLINLEVLNKLKQAATNLDMVIRKITAHTVE